MADVPVVKSYNLYIGTKKVATATSHDSEVDKPGELTIMSESVVRTGGPATSKLTLNTITTFGGNASTQLLIQALIDGTPLKLVTGPVDGKLREYYPMFCHSEKLSTDFSKGSATGVYSFEGAAPKISG